MTGAAGRKDESDQQAEIKNPNILAQQNIQPESGAVDHDVMQARKRNADAAERVEQADDTATEEP